MSSPHLTPHSEHISRAIEILVRGPDGIKKRLKLALKSANFIAFGITPGTLSPESLELYREIVAVITHNQKMNYADGIDKLSRRKASEVADKIFDMYRHIWVK